MPTYQVTDPKTGRVLRLTGDTPPSDDDLDQLFAEYRTPAESIPIFDDQGNPIEVDIPGANKPEQASALNFLGPAEAIATVGTGLLSSLQGAGTGLVDSVTSGAFLEGKGPEMVQQSIQDYTQAGTYRPKTQAGQDIVGAIGKVGENLPPVIAGFSPAQMAIAGQSARASSQVAPTVAREAAQAAKQALPAIKPASSVRSMGAAEVPEEVVQYMKFQDLPVKIPVTMADIASGDERFVWKQLENENMKDAENGAKLREKAAQKNAAVQDNFEAFIDKTETTIPEGQYALLTGDKVRESLKSGKAEGKARVTSAYQRAREAGELSAPIPQERLDAVSAFVNENRADRGAASILSKFADEVVNIRELGTGSIDDGTFKLGQITLDQAETLRQRVNKLKNSADAKDLAYAARINSLIDQAQEGLGGNLFKSARKQAKQEFDKYENNVIIKDILANKGRSNDPKVAAEQIVQKAVFGGSVNDLDNFRLTLMKSGSKGVEAWKDVQAATLRTIRDEALRAKSTVDTAGLVKAQAGTINKMVDNLDKNGKLNKIFGKQGADQLRLLKEVSARIAEQMPGTLNTSNTASSMVMFLRNLPVVGRVTTTLESLKPLVADAKLRAKINQAVNVEKTLKKKGIDVEKYMEKPQK